ncbi:MAG: hypothetical protein Q4F15_04820 [Bacillota bacterium]|nr:hypothetical protein [Bacillota bacterium]
MHIAVWDSGIALVYIALCCVAIFFLSIISLILFNISGVSGPAKVAVSLSFVAILMAGFPIDYGIETACYNAYISFSPEKWQNVDGQYKAPMARDFLDRYEVKEMQVNEIVELLGEPQEEGLIRESGQEYDYYFRYDCGSPTHWHGPYPWALDFYTSGDDRGLTILDYQLRDGVDLSA